jgi:multidrug efflux system outer membrane protein
MPKHTPLLVLGLGLLSGCSLAPSYKRPEAPLAPAYPVAAEAKGSTVAAELDWKRFYSEPRLAALIGLALENNRDLRVAVLNVERVRALYRIQRTALIPSLDATAAGSRSRSPGDLNSTGQSRLSDAYSAGLQVPSYEVDLFGRVTSLRDQVLEQYLATDDVRLATRISVVSAVARQYYTLLAADEQLAIARESFRAADESCEINRRSFEAGVNSEIDLRSSEAQREAYRASAATLEYQRTKAENALVLLLGCPLPAGLPASGSLEHQELLEELPAGLPSELLTRRPDVRAAEHTLRSANANIGVARAAFFPAIKLTAGMGTASADLNRLFDAGQQTWSFAPTITLPLFASGKNRATLDVAKLQKLIEVENYEKAVQAAFRDVADGLAVRAGINTVVAAQKARVEAAQKRYDLTDQRYRAGVTSYLNLLLAQQDLYAARQSYVDARLSRLLNLSTLYAALGGGWQ